ncbi:MAG: DUF4920 domain-containing protein [Bacteroidota bacterium]
MPKYLFAFFVLPLVVACGSTDVSTEDQQVDESVVAAPEYAGEIFGEGEYGDFEESISLPELLEATADLPEGDSLDVIVRAEVSDVCKKKGCWMSLGDEGDVFVRFKDYGFFVPTDIPGREVVAEGKAYYQVTSVEELRHYAEDDGQTPEEIARIIEPERELRFLATGVLLFDEAEEETE